MIAEAWENLWELPLIQRVALDSAFHLVLIENNFSVTGKSISFSYFVLSPTSPLSEKLLRGNNAWDVMGHNPSVL